jgi:hypothetical protein
MVVPVATRMLMPAPLVNFRSSPHLSIVAVEKLTDSAVPVAMVPVASRSHSDTQAPSAVAPPTVLVYSPSLVTVPVHPDTPVWLLVAPSVVLMLSVVTRRMAKSPAANALVAVVTVSRLPLVLPVPVPDAPTCAIAIPADS